MSTLLTLVDYDNVPQELRRMGVDYVVRRVAAGLTAKWKGAPSRIRVRLYGGWYEGQHQTRVAQQLAVEIEAKFPSTIPTDAGVVPVQVELAYALEAAPTHHLLATFRRRSRQSNIGCHDPSLKGCQARPCEMESLFRVMSSGACPRIGCSFTTEDLLFRDQQKLVDTMLAADLLHSSRLGDTVAIVSSDDDLWPPILAATLYGGMVLHVHTRPGWRTPPFYSRTAGPRYSQIEI